MAIWNGMTVDHAAHRIALQIEANCGLATLPAGYNIAGIKSDLRRLYGATGGKRTGPSSYDPTAAEYRGLYNGQFTGAELLARYAGQTAPKAVEAVEPVETAPVTVEEAPVVVEATDTDAMAKALATLLGGQKVDPAAVKRIAETAVNDRVAEVMASMDTRIAEQVAKQVRTVEVKVAEMPTVKVGTVHKDFEQLLAYAANRQNVMAVGPAGCGKTHMAEQVATALKLDFYFSGKCADETKIIGFMDGGGTYRSTAFRRAFEFGGVFLFDEVDGWSPEAIIAVNAPLAGMCGDFPDGMVRRHPDFVAIGAANTFGRGADREYVSREQLDAATLDRFAVLEIGYDEQLELAISCNADWTRFVQKVRAAIARLSIRHIVSPRASIGGGVMLAAGRDRKEVEDAYIWKGVKEDVRNRVLAEMR